MKIVSDNCQCSHCINKYYCKDYSMIVAAQTINKKYLRYGTNDITIVFQVERCPNRQTRKAVKK